MDAEEILGKAYRAFNARDVEAAVALMDEDVDWPNAWEGGRVKGRDAVRGYWQRQFESISSEVVPERFEHHPNGEVTVLVHQVVHDAESGAKLSEGQVRHRYRIEDGLIVRMDVLADAPPAG
jgi:ketosteroid isomerase-like protein